MVDKINYIHITKIQLECGKPSLLTRINVIEQGLSSLSHAALFQNSVGGNVTVKVARAYVMQYLNL